MPERCSGRAERFEAVADVPRLVMFQSMRRLFFIVLVSAVVHLPAEAKAATGGARAFLSRVIAYEVSGHADTRSQIYLAFFMPRFRAAIRADMADAEVGVLDYDPICQCQDDGGLAMQVISLKRVGRNARAIIERNIGGKRGRVILSLVETSAGWQIADVATTDRPSLLRILERKPRRGS